MYLYVLYLPGNYRYNELNYHNIAKFSLFQFGWRVLYVRASITSRMRLRTIGHGFSLCISVIDIIMHLAIKRKLTGDYGILQEKQTHS